MELRGNLFDNMPCLTSESFMKSVEKLPRTMCSTPVSIDDGVCDNTSSSSVLSNDDLFNECYANIQWELEKLQGIQNSKEECINRLLNVLYNSVDDSKLDCFEDVLYVWCVNYLLNVEIPLVIKYCVEFLC